MEALSFIGVSIIEYAGFMVAMLALFRYPVTYYWPQIVFTSVVCSALSYALSVQNDISTAPIIQLVVLALCVWLMFNTPLIWSMIMCVSSFAVYTVFQGGIVYLLFSFGWVQAVVPKASVSIYLIQLFCAAFCFVLGYYWLRKRIGFLFVPTSRDVRFVWNKTGIWLFIGSVVSCFASAIVFMIYPKPQLNWFYILLIVLLVISGVLLYILKRKNHEYVEKPWTR
jgi:hypothetical protein